MAFKKAERKQVRLKVGMAGPSGTGKTMSALRLATGIGGRIAGIDTENGSMSLYADKFEFEVEEITPPFITEKYIAAIHAAEKAGFRVLIIDSMSHAWSGEGGLLEQKEVLDGRGGKQNAYTNWAPITKKHEAFKSAILHCNLDVICTMRSKQDYQQVEREGKKAIEKLGMAPIQREGWEYEFTTFFDLTADNMATTTKDRTSMFVGKHFQITEETGKMLMDWRDSGVWVAGKMEGDRIAVLRQKNGWNNQEVLAYMNENFKKDRLSLLTKPEFERLIDMVSRPRNQPTVEVDQPRTEESGIFATTDVELKK